MKNGTTKAAITKNEIFAEILKVARDASERMEKLRRAFANAEGEFNITETDGMGGISELGYQCGYAKDEIRRAIK